jgi:hypothetical protein
MTWKISHLRSESRRVDMLRTTNATSNAYNKLVKKDIHKSYVYNKVTETI